MKTFNSDNDCALREAKVEERDFATALQTVVCILSLRNSLLLDIITISS